MSAGIFIVTRIGVAESTGVSSEATGRGSLARKATLWEGDAMNDRSPKGALPDRVIAGNESAWFELDERFRDRICRLAEREMNTRYQAREDPEDIAVSVMKTFFEEIERGRYEQVDFEHTGALWKLLEKMAKRKVIKHVEYQRAKKRDQTREVQTECELPAVKQTGRRANLLGWAIEQALKNPDSTASCVLRLTIHGYPISEIVRIVFDKLPPPYPQVLALRLQGHTEEEIAKELGIGREAVRYRVRRIQRRLAKLLGD